MEIIKPLINEGSSLLLQNHMNKIPLNLIQELKKITESFDKKRAFEEGFFYDFRSNSGIRRI